MLQWSYWSISLSVIIILLMSGNSIFSGLSYFSRWQRWLKYPMSGQNNGLEQRMFLNVLITPHQMTLGRFDLLHWLGHLYTQDSLVTTIGGPSQPISCERGTGGQRPVKYDNQSGMSTGQLKSCHTKEGIRACSTLTVTTSPSQDNCYSWWILYKTKPLLS